jgi:lipopolysaccharide export system protein LptA
MTLNRRTLLTGSTCMFLCGLYEAYALFASPWFSPREAFEPDQGPHTRDPAPPKPAENRRQAEAYLSDQEWTYKSNGAADGAKYQFRSDTGFFYFNEWETLETGQVRFHPFAMIWRPKGHPPEKAPYTIISESALVEFASKFEVTNPNPGRVVGGALEGKVRIRGPDNLAVDGKHFNFAERALRIWSDHAVFFQQGPHKGSGHGLDLDLIPAPASDDKDKPAVSGIKTVRLRKDVEMRLVSESKSPEKPAEDEIVFVNSEGNFNFDVEAHLATFEKNVRVKRPTGKGQIDRLNCDLLTLFFEPKPSIAPATSGADGAGKPVQAAAAAPKTEADSGFGNLEFRRLRAEGQVVTVASQRSEMQGRMHELTYDAKDRVIVLRDAKQVALLQKNNELLCPEITAGLDDSNQIERATCRGAGQLFNYAPDADSKRVRTSRQVELAAKWQKKLNKSFDATTGLDLIEFEGRAELSQAGKSSLTAEIIRIWVTPSDQKLDAIDKIGSPAGEAGIQPKKLLALHEVEFASPQIRGQTETLQIWFDEGGLPSPPLAQDSRQNPPAVRRPNSVAAAPVSRQRLDSLQQPGTLQIAGTSGQAFAAIGDSPAERASTNNRPPTISPAGKASGRQPGKSPGKSRSKQPEKTVAKPGAKSIAQPGAHPLEKDSENPLVVNADLIRVQVLREGEESKVSEVFTEGHVHITQAHKAGELPLDLTGDRLDLKNYSGSTDNQIVDIKGRPARVQDRKMQLEGPEIHFDRITNNANVKGPGVLRVPVPNGIDGKPLPVPQMLDVFWKDAMEFDGEVAQFFAGVRSKLDGSEVSCEEMRVTFSRRISFAEDASARDNQNGQPAEIHSVVCRYNVDLKSYEYENNRLISRRTAHAVEFTFDHTSGRITSQGPGTLQLWRKGNGNRAGMKPTASASANKSLAAEPVEWEYTRIDFKGRMVGNTNDQTTTFRYLVHVVYGPVPNSTDVIDEENMPKDGGWMSCHELTLTQMPATKTEPAYVTMRAVRDAELDGRSFHAVAHIVTYDESKGLYVLTGDGKRNATIWQEKTQGAQPSATAAQRMEFTPARKILKITDAAYGQGSK